MSFQNMFKWVLEVLIHEESIKLVCGSAMHVRISWIATPNMHACIQFNSILPFHDIPSFFSSMTCQWAQKWEEFNFYMPYLHELGMNVMPSIEFKCCLSLNLQISSNSLQILLFLSKVLSSPSFSLSLNLSPCVV